MYIQAATSHTFKEAEMKTAAADRHPLEVNKGAAQ